MVSPLGRASCNRLRFESAGNLDLSAWPAAVQPSRRCKRCAESQGLYDAPTRARGDERLSAKQRSESDGGAHGKRTRPGDAAKKVRKQRSGDIGRALRTIYDDTLRESVPDDFSDLLGKLS